MSVPHVGILIFTNRKFFNLATGSAGSCSSRPTPQHYDAGTNGVQVLEHSYTRAIHPVVGPTHNIRQRKDDLPLPMALLRWSAGFERNNCLVLNGQESGIKRRSWILSMPVSVYELKVGQAPLDCHGL